MKILILTVGTRGDVQPYLALAIGLQKAGHQVQLCTHQMFDSLICRYGIDHAPINNDLRAFMDSEAGREAMETTTNLIAAIRTGIRLLPLITEMMRRQIQEMWQAAEAFQPDVILFHKKAIGAEDFAEKLGCRCGLAFYLPMYVPTATFPAFGFPRFPSGSLYNRSTYRVVEAVTRMSSGKFIKPWRKEQNLPRKRPPYFCHADGRPIPAIHAFSPSVIPQPADWPDHATVTGYWFLNALESETPDSELVRFLEAGPPPVYVGFGSIFGKNPRDLTARVIEGIRRSGFRAILASGWGGLDVTDFTLPDSIFTLKSAPHDWLFPRVSAVVHHGGCGTTAAGLRAGRPNLICPFFGDQPFWGNKVHALGAGPKPIPQRKLTADHFCKALQQLVNDEQLRLRAEEVGRQLQNEDGVSNAVRFIENQFA